MLGDLIKSRRISRGLTQRDLANVVGAGVSTVEAYEQGLREPNIAALLRIAYACDLPLSTFVSPLDDVRLIERDAPYRDKARGITPPTKDEGEDDADG